MVCRTTLNGCWGCGRRWEDLRYEPLVYDPTDTGYYCKSCDVYSTKGTIEAFTAWSRRLAEQPTSSKGADTPGREHL